MSALPKAFLPEEGGAAQAVTEGAAREQVCIRGQPDAIHIAACSLSLRLRRIQLPQGAYLALPEGETSLVCA